MAHKTLRLQYYKNGEIHKTQSGKFQFLLHGVTKGEFETIDALVAAHQDKPKDKSKKLQKKSIDK